MGQKSVPAKTSHNIRGYPSTEVASAPPSPFHQAQGLRLNSSPASDATQDKERAQRANVSPDVARMRLEKSRIVLKFYKGMVPPSTAVPVAFATLRLGYFGAGRPLITVFCR